MNDAINYKTNPLHGVSLKSALTEIVNYYGFDILFVYLNINCFRTNPSNINGCPRFSDFLTSVTGLGFEECYQSKVQFDLQSTVIDFIDLESFKKNTKVVGRHQGLVDLEQAIL